MQLLHQRVAGAAINLYAMAAVISKLQGMLESAGETGHAHAGHNGNGNGNGHSPAHSAAADLHRDLVVGKGFCRRAAAEVGHSLHGLFRNHDADSLAVADTVMGWEGKREE